MLIISGSDKLHGKIKMKTKRGRWTNDKFLDSKFSSKSGANKFLDVEIHISRFLYFPREMTRSKVADASLLAKYQPGHYLSPCGNCRGAYDLKLIQAPVYCVKSEDFCLQIETTLSYNE